VSSKQWEAENGSKTSFIIGAANILHDPPWSRDARVCHPQALQRKPGTGVMWESRSLSDDGRLSKKRGFNLRDNGTAGDEQ